MATLYRDCPYTGAAVGLPEGTYTLAQLRDRGINDNDVSSLKINSGYEVQLFDTDGFGGASLTLTGDVSCLTDNPLGTGTWNDKLSSVQVRKAGLKGDPNLAGVYTLQNRNSGLNLDVNAASTADQARVQQYQANSCTCQQFRLTHLGNGLYSIIAQHSGKGLGVSAASQNNAAAIVQLPYGGEASQQFYAVSTGGGYYKLVAKHSGKVVEVAASSTANLALVQQYTDNNSATQQWKLNTVGSSTVAFSRQLEAEAATTNSGMQMEACSEGGQNAGYVDPGDFLSWNAINFPTSGAYQLEYRVSSGTNGGTFSADLNGGAVSLGSVSVPATGSWQSWTTVSKTVTVTAGTYTLAVRAQSAGWNLNWVRITKVDAAAADLVASAGLAAPTKLTVYPNPVSDQLTVQAPAAFAGAQVTIVNSLGQQVWQSTYDGQAINVSALRSGMYTLLVVGADRQKLASRFSKL